MGTNSRCVLILRSAAGLSYPGGEYPYGPKVTARLRNPVRLQMAAFRSGTFPRGELSTPADELAGVGFVQEALNRFEMGVILKK